MREALDGQPVQDGVAVLVAELAQQLVALGLPGAALRPVTAAVVQQLQGAIYKLQAAEARAPARETL